MLMKYTFLFFLSVGLFSYSKQTSQADLIIHGGKIYTGEDSKPVVEAVAVKDDKILFAGAEQEVTKFRSDKTKIIDLQGKTMTSGFIEGHGHLLGLGFNELTLNLADVRSYEELVSKVKEAT